MLTSRHHVYANLVVKEILSGRPGEVAAIFESSRLLPGRSWFSALWRYLMVSGPRYVAAQAVKQWWFRFGSALAKGDPRSLLVPYGRLAHAGGVPLEPVDDVNSDAFLARLSFIAPDVIVSVLFNQILGERMLAIAPRGAFNLHPAPLPAFGGVSPTFWTLATGAPRAGVSVHAMDEGVDTGQVVARETFDSAPFVTEHGLYLEAARRGARLLLGVLDALGKGEAPAPLPSEGPRSYFSLPSREAYRELRNHGKGLFSARELLFPGN